jgi:mono/diheme cytochrome c family protein
MLSIPLALFLLATVGFAGETPWTAPAAEKAMKNPVAKAEGVRDGKKSYSGNCAVCHGPAGKGDGPGAAALNPKPRNLADKAIQNQTDGELFWKVTRGRGAMPPWQHLPERERWSLVHYIRSLTR